jgi:hypothetical protein
MEIPEQYILNLLYAHADHPILNKHDGTYNAGCPICREGKSWGRKKRLYYYPKTKSFYCFNCNESWSALGWIKELTQMSYEDISEEIRNNDFSRNITENINQKEIKKIKLPSLPLDSVNVLDTTQQNFYKNNSIFQKTISYIKERRLDTAINASKTYYLSFNDYFHKNRLCIPFLNEEKKIIFYQTRALDGTLPKYLGKYNTDKSLFGFERIDSTFECLFMFEGPIDAMFIKNGLSIGGLNLTNCQKKQLSIYPFHKKVWVLDNIKIDKSQDTKKKTLQLINQGEKVFKWPDVPYKDINEWCVSEKIDQIDPKMILKNLY